jgi:hypothetical protein
MNIQYKPADPNARPDKRVITNIGEFLPNEVRGVGEEQEAEAKRLVENGEFVVSDEAPNSEKLADSMPKAMEKWTAAKAKRDAEVAAAPVPTATTRLERAVEKVTGKAR